METRAPVETLDRRAGAAVGSITIARHGQPDADRSVKLTAPQFVDWWSSYNRTGLMAGELPPPALLEIGRATDTVFASTLPRAVLTAEAAAPGKVIITDDVFTEAPLPPPNMAGRRSPRAWGVWARMSWWMGNSKGEESRAHAEVRAEAAVATVTSRALRGENVLLCAHGWFNRMMRPVLKRQGWRCVYDGGDAYWSYRIYKKVR